MASRLFVWQLILITALTAALGVVNFRHTGQQIRDDAGARVLSVAATLAHDPFVAAGLETANPTTAFQPFAEEVMTEANVDFVTIMRPDGTRLTHPDEQEIGDTYLGSREQALAGEVHVEQYTGTLGPSVRAIAPVFDGEGTVIGMVAVGVTLQTIQVALASDIPAILVVAAVALTLGAIGSYAVSRYLRRATLGLGPEGLRRRFVYANSALHSLREGLLLTDARGQLVLYNDRAAELLDLPPLDLTSGPRQTAPEHATADALPSTIRDLLDSGRRAHDEVHVDGERILILTQQPAEGGGAVATVQDHTEWQSLAGELETMRTLTTALRAQTHEHANRLHAVGALIELGRYDEALSFAVEDRHTAQALTDDVVQRLDEPYLSSLLVGKAAEAHERGLTLTLSASGTLPHGAIEARDLVTITGNLLDNAFDAAAAGDRDVWADFAATPTDLTISVADSGEGIDPDLIDAFLRFGVSSKPGEPRGLGLALVRQTVRRLGGTLEIENDGGAIFTVSLPLASHAEEHAQPAPCSSDESGEVTS
nr:sensor histidine kinase [Zhihengliuella flava]